MQILVPPVSTGLQQEEKYRNIARDRWGKWRESLDEKTANKANSDETSTAEETKNPIISGHSEARPLNFAPEPDSQAHLLFNATLLRPR